MIFTPKPSKSSGERAILYSFKLPIKKFSPIETLQLSAANDTLFSGYFINFGVRFIVSADRRFNATQVKLNVIDAIKDIFKVEKMQFKQSINLNDLQYNILSLDGVIGIQELKLFQDGNDEYATGRKLYYYQGDGDIVSDGNIDYGFQYNFENALENGIYRPSVTPAVFELRNERNEQR